jgi:iron complex outermembrane receptor protein
MRVFFVLPMLLAAAPAMAQQPAMEHVLVSVPLHKKTAETALPVTVLSGDDLRRAASSTIGETLHATPGLASASFGPGVGQPVIRGQQGARVTVLQNGTSSADASNLSADHANSVEPMLADSIEILRGPATLLYGGGAIGGVINIVDNRIPTSVPDQTSGGVEYRRDSASDMDVGVFQLDAGSGSLAFHADGLYRDWNDLEVPGQPVREDGHDNHEGEAGGTDGHIANTDGDTHSYTLGGSYHVDAGFAGLAVNYLENEYGIPSGAHEGHEGENDELDEEEGGIRLEVEQTRYDGALHWHDPTGFLEVLRGFLTYTDYQHKEIEGSGEVGTRYSNETWEGRLELVHHPIGPFHGVFGVQARAGEFSALGEEAFIPKTDNADLGLFLLEDYHRGDWTYEAGLRLDRVERDPQTNAADQENFNAVSLSGSALWDIDTQWQLGLALSRAERAPAAEELFSNIEAAGPQDWVVHAATDAIELGNPALDTEVSNNVDVSLRWWRDDHFIDITLFYNDFTDYINLLNTGRTVGDTAVFVYAQDDAEFYGVEIDSEFDLIEMGGGQIALGLFGDSIRGKLDQGGDAPRLPPRRIGGRLSWTGPVWKVWTLWVGADDQNKPGDNEAATDSYARWDMGGEYRIVFNRSELLLSLEWKNIADEEIRLSTSFLRDVAPEAGRSVVAALRYTF